jgi:hypothetical protein
MGIQPLREIMHVRARGKPQKSERRELPQMMFQEYLRVLSEVKEGSLKGLKRLLTFDLPDLKESVDEDMEMPEGFMPIGGIAEYRRGAGEYLTLFDRGKREVDINFHDVFRQQDGDPNSVFEDLNNAFGGELYVGPRLCYRDGVEISQPWHKITVPWGEKSRRNTFEGEEETFFIMLMYIGDIWHGDGDRT